MAVTFDVSPVERARTPLGQPEETLGHSARPPFLLGRPVEAWGSNPPRCLHTRQHGLLTAVGTAFDLHYPLVLTPDAIWLAIAQGFACHVNANAEQLQGKFVRHAGRAELHVRRDDFIKGSPQNPWTEVFSSFSEQIAAHIGRQRDLVICDFSTTGPCERAVSEIVLMDAMQSYFKYIFHSLCGIPAITLEGTVDDYRAIRRRVQALDEYDLSWWTEALLPIVDRFVAAFDHPIDVAFWRSIFKRNEDSGGPFITGWINAFFPYFEGGDHRLRRNPYVCSVPSLESGAGPRGPRGLKEDYVPSGLSVAAFAWNCIGQQYPMELLGGFVGVAQDEGTLAVRPAIGWAVRDAWPSAEARKPLADAYGKRGPVYLRNDSGITGAMTYLIAGRASLGRTLQEHDPQDVDQMLGALQWAHGVNLRCFVDLEEGAPGGEDELALKPRMLIIGIQLASSQSAYDVTLAAKSFAEAEEQLQRVPASFWRDLSAVVPGGFSSNNEAHFVSVANRPAEVRALLVLGERTEWLATRSMEEGEAEHVYATTNERWAVRGVKVAEVHSAEYHYAIVDMSVAADAEHRARVRSIGVEAETAAYHLVTLRLRERSRGRSVDK